MNLTPHQQRAIFEHDKNLIVVAGAGSGKTRVLVERYLYLLDTYPDWPLNALVAITFTRKAAQEMRDRVRQALEERFRTASTFVEQGMWLERLASMDSARIDTFHGLCASILRANAAEAGLDPHFVVLDEVEAAMLLDDVIDAELQALIDAGDEAVSLFTEYDSKALRDVLVNFASDDLPALPDDLFAAWLAEWEEQAIKHLQALRTDLDFLEWVYWTPPDGWPAEDDKLLDIWQELHRCCRVFLNPDTPVTECVAALEQIAALKIGSVGSQDAWGSKEIVSAARRYARTIKNYVETAYNQIGNPPGHADERAARLIPLWCRLINRVQAAYQQAKQGDLDFDDLERRTRDLLNRHDRVRARYQNGEVRHVLVDEFQDTNAVQWEIVRALANPSVPGCLFIVGDQKQSIYAFRGADVSVFGMVRAFMTEIWGAQAEVPLARSFRAHSSLVNCFNTVFQRILKREPRSQVYDYEIDLGEPMDAFRLDAPSDSPVFELLLVSPPEDQKLAADDKRRWEAYEIARRIHELVSANTPVFDKASGQVRPMRYDDVALLFQSMSSVNLYEDVFKAQQLPFVTIAGRGYYNRQEVWDLLNLLNALYNPADNLALASVLRSPLFGLSDDALLALRLVMGADGKPMLLWDALDQSAPLLPDDEIELVAFARDCLYALHTLAGRVTISELLREALAHTGYLATLTGLPDGARRRGNVEKLLDKAESSGKVTLGAFSEYLRDLSAREVREGEAVIDVEGAVTLMTVHASKGLEFPLVVLVDSSWERTQRGSLPLVRDGQGGLACKVFDLETDKLLDTYTYRHAEHLRRLRETAERKRLLYVAATRAQDYLMVSGSISFDRNGQPKTGEWLSWLLEALDLNPALNQPGVLERDWGKLRLHLATQIPPEDAYIAGERSPQTAWDDEAVRAGQPLPGEAVKPPLMNDVRVDRTVAARHLTVTHLVDLGASFDLYHQRRFRQSVLHDAPASIDPASTRRLTQRLIGEIVHEALRWWRFPGEVDNLAVLLDSYAWELGIVDDVQREKAVREATELLAKFQRDPIYRWVIEARQVFRELPFVYKTDKRIIHGALDMLIQRSDGRWALVDYKTAWVPTAHAGQAAFVEHARRFHLQVGAYAEAVREQLRQVNNLDVTNLSVYVYIHYIRYSRTVEIHESEWQAALANLEGLVGKMIG